MHPLLQPSQEVRDALSDRRPVVALESTIISHGMPYPANVETARRVEARVREHGAVPATIALIDGALCVGLDAALLERIGRSDAVGKASSRDLAAVMASGGSAGTTVAATMWIAAMAGIAVFATGGVGGVHRGAEATFDISADLTELAHTPVAVVCAGVKSILDIPKTLEVLETQRVPVLGYRTTQFPAFFSRGSGESVEHRCDSAEAIARVIHLHRAIGLRSGVLVANPLPEADALGAEAIEATIAEACDDAANRGIAGKALTPFLLARINELSAGRSLAANVALILNNAALAADIAVALSRLG
jgi:pseudouridine-5'-phosphate glycosidase